jgi:hypothetical protein
MFNNQFQCQVDKNQDIHMQTNIYKIDKFKIYRD